MGLEDIDLNFKESPNLVSPNPLVKSINVSEFQEVKTTDNYPHLKQQRLAMKQVKIISLKKLTNLKEKYDDMFFVISKCSLLPYVSALFFTTVTLTSLYF